MDPVEICLEKASTGELVPSLLRDMDPVVDLKCWKERWQPLLSQSHEEDRSWNWSEKFMQLHTVNYEYYAIECQQSTQGLMIIDTDFHRSRSTKLNLVYVSFLATAPWNRREVANPEFRRVGAWLLRHAVMRSEELGYKFRTGLHSLPKSERFYDLLEMENYGPDADMKNLKYYEFSERTGQKFVEG